MPSKFEEGHATLAREIVPLRDSDNKLVNAVWKHLQASRRRVGREDADLHCPLRRWRHPNGRHAYVVNQLDSTVTTYAYNRTSAQLTPLQILPTLPETFTGNSRAAEIEVDCSGRFVFASNRGHDSIAVFAVDPGTGLLHFAGADLSQGRTPRFFARAPPKRAPALRAQ